MSVSREVEGQWRCKHCDRPNALTESTCYLCGDASPRPSQEAEGRRWLIRKKRPEPFDTEFGSIVGPAADFPVEVCPVSVVEELRRQLKKAQDDLAYYAQEAERP